MCLLMRIVCVTVCTGRILAMSSKHLYNAVYSLVCRAELLLKWCQQVDSSYQEAAEELQTSLSTLLKVFICYIFNYTKVSICYIFNYTCSYGLLMHTNSVLSSHAIDCNLKPQLLNLSISHVL